MEKFSPKIKKANSIRIISQVLIPLLTSLLQKKLLIAENRRNSRNKANKEEKIMVSRTEKSLNSNLRKN